MDDSLNLSRQNFEKLGLQYAPAENVTIEQELIGEVTCYWFCKKGVAVSAEVLIYLHGGCFVLGSIHSHKALVSHLANELSVPLLFIEYSLAPEKQFPFAINEIVKVYESLVSKKNIHQLSFVGDSAGAAMAVSSISEINKRNLQKPGCLVMFSPWIDLRNNSSSIQTNADKDQVLTQGQLQKYTALYIGNNNLKDTNPIENIYGKFPPTLILVGSYEILLDDTILIHEVISKNQPLTEINVFENQTHVWLLDDIKGEVSIQTIRTINGFLKRR